MPVATLLSILFFFTFAIYLMAGVYTLLLNARGRINHVFFLLCLSLAIWAVSFAFANAADSLAEATRWRGPYLDDGLPQDPWGQPYQYSTPGANGQPFALYSLGADGKLGGTGDDADIGILPAQ